MARKKSVRSQLYRAARNVGNLDAAETVASSIRRRYTRRKVYAMTYGMTRIFPRSIGLSK
jgi:hypothetical protein